MDLKEVMTALEELGTEQARKIYKRHGSGPNVFGVSFANIYKIQKKIKVDHELALQLWDTGNTDAQSLATLVLDPQKMTKAQAKKWATANTYYMNASMVANAVAQTPHAMELMWDWMKSSKEYVKQAGYNVFSAFMRAAEVDEKAQTVSAFDHTLSFKDLEKILDDVLTGIQASPNRARHAMNGALIAVGGYVKPLYPKATEYAEKIGKVEVDHGETSCKTPAAIPYMKKMWDRQNKKKAKKKIC